MTHVDKTTSSLSTLNRRTLLAGMSAAAFLPAMPSIVRAQSDTVRIGFPVPLTGAFGAEAQDQVRCAELAVAQVNAAGGIAGRKVELLVRDDKLNPGEAATRALELIEKDKVHFVVGALAGNRDSLKWEMIRWILIVQPTRRERDRTRLRAVGLPLVEIDTMHQLKRLYSLWGLTR